MGFYVNPKGCSKEQWLREHSSEKLVGAPVDGLDVLEKLNPPCLPVCLVDNRIFTAAGIGYCREEIIAFNQPNDQRPKQWYAVPIKDLLEVEPLLSKVIPKATL